MKTAKGPGFGVHRRGRGRAAIHLLVVVVAMGAVGFAARYPADAGPATNDVVPTFSLSGVAGGTNQAILTTYLRPVGSSQTRESIAALTTRPDLRSLRATAGVSTVQSFSSGVAAAAASSGEDGAGVKPLADVLDPRQPFVLYDAQPGDTSGIIAQKYGITLRTLLDNNPTVGNKDLIQKGQQFVVPRRDGILYKVSHGDTLDSIVNQYDNTTAGTVLDYKPNNITDAKNLKPGETLLLPGATVKPPPPPPPPPPAPAQPAGGVQPANGQGAAPLPGGAGRFRYPLAAWRAVSDRFGVSRGGGTYHTGIDLDLAGYHSSNIFSACDGVVKSTEYLTYSYGYHVIVDCGDGWSTLYAHMSVISVNPGQRVSAGTVLGVSGVTGFTTGEHLHFEIRINGAPVDPAAYLKF